MRKITVLGVVLFMGLFTACKPSPDEPRFDGGMRLDGGMPSDGGGGSSSLTCGQIFDCVAACADTDEACVDDCTARGTPAGLAAAVALASCAEMNSCSDEDCLVELCPQEILDCTNTVVPPLDGGVADAGSDAGGSGDGFPNQFSGTMRDTSNADFGSIVTTDNTMGTGTFVRNDAMGVSLGYSPTAAFYYLSESTYTATLMGTVGACTLSGSATDTVRAPDPVQNNIRIEKTAGADGLYRYDIITTMAVVHPMGTRSECPPPAGTTFEDFDSHLSVTNGTSVQRTNGRTIVGNHMEGSGGGTRSWQWDLQ